MSGLTDDEIASTLQISRHTVDAYWRRIRSEFGHSSRVRCATIALFRAMSDGTADGEHLIGMVRAVAQSPFV